MYNKLSFKSLGFLFFDVPLKCISEIKKNSPRLPQHFGQSNFTAAGVFFTNSGLVQRPRHSSARSQKKLFQYWNSRLKIEIVVCLIWGLKCISEIKKNSSRLPQLVALWLVKFHGSGTFLHKFGACAMPTPLFSPISEKALLVLEFQIKN